MSTGRSEARRAEQRAHESAALDRSQRMSVEARLKKERERSQKLFIRQVRARLGGGFLENDPQPSSTLG